MKPFMQPLYTDEEWAPSTLADMLAVAEEIVTTEYGLTLHPNEVKIVTPKQMEDAMVTGALPLQIYHWYHGLQSYRSEAQGAFGFLEVVQNTYPVQSYCTENNTATEMMTVIAHAACGHNTVFKNNHLFREYTNPRSIVDYIIFARNFLRKCEEKYGEDCVADTLTACMTLQRYCVDLSRKPKQRSYEEELARLQDRVQRYEEQYNPLINDRSGYPLLKRAEPYVRIPQTPEENVLKFMEKQGPRLRAIEQWQAEIIRIIRMISAYFYPHARTKVVHEGVACTIQWKVMNRLSPLELGGLTNTAMNNFFDIHNRVIAQPGYGREREKFNGKFHVSPINYYSLGFRMFQDIERICTNPTNEDKEWFPKLAGADFWEVFRHVYTEHDDESFIRTYLSPKLIRDYAFLTLRDDPSKDYFEVTDIHNEAGYRHIRDRLASRYCYHNQLPNLTVHEVDVADNATLTLRHTQHGNVRLERKSVGEVLLQINKHLWPRTVQLESFANDGSCTDVWWIEDEEVEYTDETMPGPDNITLTP